MRKQAEREPSEPIPSTARQVKAIELPSDFKRDELKRAVHPRRLFRRNRTFKIFFQILLTKTVETVYGSSNKVLSSYNSEMTVFVAESPSNAAISLNPIALILQECLLSR